MVGYWIADRFDEIEPTALAWIAFAGAFSSIVFTRLQSWNVAFVIAAICTGACHYLIMEGSRQAKEPWLSMPIRELELTFEITRSFEREDPYGRVSGIAEIRETPKVRRDLIGKRIYFLLKPQEGAPPIIKGSIVRANGLLETLIDRPRSFNRYLANMGVAYEFRKGAVHETTNTPNWFSYLCRAVNEKLEATLRCGGMGTSALADVAVAMTLGKKAVLDDKRKGRYVTAGVMHLFAISGLHVGVVAAALAFFLRWLPGPKWLEALLGLSFLFLYVQVTGGAPSAMRAFLMVVFWWGTRLLGRSGSSLPAIVVAAFVTLLLDPRQLWNIGFQLSYCVVTAIILYGSPLASRVQAAWEPWMYVPPEDRTTFQRWASLTWKWFATAMGVSFAATLASAPLVTYHFGVFTPGAILLNVFLVLLAGIAILCGFASIVFGLFSLTFFSQLINYLQWIVIWLMDGMVKLFLAIPGLFYRMEVSSSSMVAVTTLATLALLLALARRIPFEPSWICLLPVVPLILFIVFATEPVAP
tara:strand:- start:1601 stop:3184 length:1584 start_codon:yes stop_codon:yes gene_type:complete